MNLQPTLKGKLLEVRPLTQKDFEGLYTAASDPLIWELHPQPDRYKPEIFKKFFDEALESKGALVIIDQKIKEIIGSSRYYDLKKDSVVIGYTFLAKKYWGGVYNRELKTLMINHALKSVKTTLFQVGLGNIRSQKAMTKIGGINTGIEEVKISYGPPKKSYIYKIDKPL